MFKILAVIAVIGYGLIWLWEKWQDLKRIYEVLGVKYEKIEPTDEEVSWFFTKEGK